MTTDIDKAVDEARRLDRRAESSGDDQDYEAAYVAWANAALAAHLHGIDMARPTSERDAFFQQGVEYNKIADERKKSAEWIRHERYETRKTAWSRRHRMVGGVPPSAINVLDQHGGFTAITKPSSFGTWAWRGSDEPLASKPVSYRTSSPTFREDPRAWVGGNTRWFVRGGRLLPRHVTVSCRISAEKRSSFSSNNASYSESS